GAAGPRGAGAGAHVGARAGRAGRSDRRGGAGAGAVGGHGGAAGDSPPSAARDHGAGAGARSRDSRGDPRVSALPIFGEQGAGSPALYGDRKSTRLNSSHVAISYGVFCLQKKKNI